MTSKHRPPKRRLFIATLGTLGASALIVAAQAAPQANMTKMSATSLSQMANNPNQWVMPSGNYAMWRYSKLDQIDKSNVKKMQVAWTMSTGTSRGLEGQPLVIGDMMYVETSYPNHVYAINLNDPNRFVWKFDPPPDPTHRPSPAATWSTAGRPIAMACFTSTPSTAWSTRLMPRPARSSGRSKNADPKLGQTITSAPLVVEEYRARRRFRRRVRRARLSVCLRCQDRQADVARLQRGTGQGFSVRSPRPRSTAPRKSRSARIRA